MNKICTSIEQSKKLIELGIDVNTADMHYNNLSITHGSDYVNDFNAELMDYNSAVKLLTKYTHNPLFEIIPAWSLTALIELIPDKISINNESYYLSFTKKSVEFRGPITWDGQKTKSFEKDNILDAAFEMICRLKENGKI